MKLSKIQEKLKDIPLKKMFGSSARVTVVMDITDPGYMEVCLGEDYMDIDDAEMYLEQLSGLLANLKKELRKCPR